MSDPMSNPAPIHADGRLVVVSNRLPVGLRRTDEGWDVQRSAGGLATAMGPLLKQTGGIWIGWAGDSSDVGDARRREILDRWAREDGFHTVEMSADLVRGFYEGFSNEAVWPLFHHFPFVFKFDPDHWQAYQAANRLFCNAVLEQLRPGDLVWVHDYQLMLLPRMLRDAVPDVRVGFFLHIPFPSSNVFRLLPRGDEVLDGLLGADYVAFHTHIDLHNFRSSVLRVLGLASRMDEVDVGGHSVHLDALPIGIDPAAFTKRLHEDEETVRRLEELRKQFANRHLLVAVDRLDYTKGIPERLRAYRRLLKDDEALHGKVVLLQVAVPSREKVAAYQELSHETDELVGQINGQWGTPDWTPVVYMKRGVPPSELAALYATAEVAWVTPLRDGMNLVAKEYVACHEGRDGVLVLSEFAGAATEMAEALRVNPYDEERTAETVARALSMPEDERRDRAAALYRRVVRNNVFAWGERFLRGLRASAQRHSDQAAERPPLLPVDDAVRAYRSARRRVLLLDYDGTLVGYFKRPQDAAPPPGLADRLARLAGQPENTVAIVSGRRRADLERWFGRVPGLWLAAEHGALLRPPGSAQWESARPVGSDDWKRRVRPVLDHFTDRTPGSFVEEKELSLVWHYRTADAEFGEWIANELMTMLEQALAGTELRAVRGRKIVEVKFVWATKGEVLARLESARPGGSKDFASSAPDFLLAVGDDQTDEDLFASLGDDAWSVHVGSHNSRARFRLPGPAAVHNVLARFVGEAG